MAEAASGVAEVTLGATANSASGVTDFSVGALGSLLNITEALWRGVDLVNVSATRKISKILSHDEIRLVSWLMQPESLAVTGGSEEFHKTASIMVHAVSTAMPWLSNQVDHLELLSHYHALSVAVYFDERSRVVLNSIAWQVDFTPVWVNPLWEAAEMPVEREVQQIIHRLRLFVNTSMPDPHTWPLISNPFIDQKHWHFAVHRWITRVSRYALAIIA